MDQPELSQITSTIIEVNIMNIELFRNNEYAILTPASANGGAIVGHVSANELQECTQERENSDVC